MARATARVKLTMSVKGDVPDPNFHGAVMEAQRENALRAGSYAVELARSEVKGPRPGDEPRRTLADDNMVDAYDAYVNADGDVVLYNPTQRARWFEYGTAAHPIKAVEGAERGTSYRFDPGSETYEPRGTTGAFVKGSALLRFPNNRGGFTFTDEVLHPGTDAHHILARTLEDNADEFKDNILRKVKAEMRGRG